MRKVAIARNHHRVHNSRQKRSIRMRERRQQKRLRRKRQNNQLRRRTNAIDSETLQPFFEIVALCAENEVLIAAKRLRNRKRLRRNRRNICDERLPAVRQQMPKQNHKSRIQPKRKQRIRSPHQQEPNHLARRQNASQRGKRTMCPGVRRRLILKKGGLLARHHLSHSSRIASSLIQSSPL